MANLGISRVDFVYIVGDAYVDHPSFGHAIISRVLQSKGFTVGIISQPDWKDKDSIDILGEPRLGFLVTSGNMDSMVNHYTVAKKRRNSDAYSPGGVSGRRPDYAVVCYCNMIRRLYPKKPIIIGGIEASLRRLAHYDYWSGRVKHSILVDSGADIISYGMGERSIVEIAEALDSGIDIKDITFIPGTVYKARSIDLAGAHTILPDYDSVSGDKRKYADSFYTQYCNTDPFSGMTLVEKYRDNLFVIQNPPSKPLSTREMDDIYDLPYMRTYHPMYERDGGVPAISEVRFSIVSSRGCFGGCNFCALTFHQGRIIQSRSHESILKEAKMLTKDPDFKGYIHDVGGPTANFRAPACDKQLTKGACIGKQCLFPKPCASLKADHSDYVELLRKLRGIPGVKKVFIRSGIRYDYLLEDGSNVFFHELCRYHISGQLKVAPEHVSDKVLKLMGKPDAACFNRFCEKYRAYNDKIGKKQFLVPYLMSSHPGSTLDDALCLAEYLRDMKMNPEQVQDFYPTPSTISTCMYYTGVDPRTGKKVYVPDNPHEKAMQRALIQYRNPDNREIVKEALIKAGRGDLIGYDRRCLIRPDKKDGRLPTEGSDRGGPSGKRPNPAKAGAKKKKKTIRNIHKKKNT
ncbi:MAG: YgiQ family radical SAM protein [Lachnospiraceae bacterium]|nr:YgiQ family radical SAM protein [Lachnospiraceae bacterium]